MRRIHNLRKRVKRKGLLKDAGFPSQSDREAAMRLAKRVGLAEFVTAQASRSAQMPDSPAISDVQP